MFSQKRKDAVPHRRSQRSAMQQQPTRPHTVTLAVPDTVAVVMMKRALVLAGGGLAGIAWETGILRGVADESPATAQNAPGLRHAARPLGWLDRCDSAGQRAPTRRVGATCQRVAR